MRYNPYVILIIFVFGMWVGAICSEHVTELRAKNLPDDIDCFTSRDIEYILYGTPPDNKRVETTNQK